MNPAALYAEKPTQRSRQVLTDLLAVLVLLMCAWIGDTVHDATSKLAGPGRSIESAGSELAEKMEEAADVADDLPGVGDELASPLNGASDVGERIEDAGVQQQDAVATLAVVLGFTAGGVPAIWLLLRWLPARLRFARRAEEGRSLRESPEGVDLLALRALARQPISALLRMERGPVTGWREQDPQVIAELAHLELEHLGLRGNASTTG
jgi:hypothetical protein